MDGNRKGIKCNRCAAILPNKQSFQNHKNTFHMTLYKCRHCPKQFMQSQSMASHCRVAHSAVIKKQRNLLIKKRASLNLEQCKYCGKPFISLTKLKMHMKKFHTDDNQKKTKEKAKLKNLEELSMQDPSFDVYTDTSGTYDPDNHKASTSAFPHDSFDDVRSGSQTTVNDESEMILKQTEENDGNFSSSSEDAKTTKMPDAKAFKGKRLRLNSRVYRCKYCPKTFSTSTCMASHVRCHYAKLQEGSIKCGTCSAGASSMTELRAHVNKLHKNCRSYCCGLCGYLTNQIGKFRVHLQYTHMQIKHNCTVCSRPFPSNNLLKKHYLREHAVKKSGKPSEFLRRDHCKLECHSDDDLEVRKKIHMKKLYKCDLCKYECYSENLLARHNKQSHNSSKPAHSAIVKNDAEVNSVDATIPAAELLPFFCGMCGSKFPKTEYLLHHITVHIEGKYVYKKNNNGSVLSAVSAAQNKPMDVQVNQKKC